jgi:hypothetical protein
LNNCHRVEYLCEGKYWLATYVCFHHHPLLSNYYFVRREFHPEIVAVNHYTICNLQDLFKITQTLKVLNLSKYLDTFALFFLIQNSSDFLNVFRSSYEWSSNNINSSFYSELLNQHLFMVAQRRHIQYCTW